jgi:hypothetical protein
MKIIIYINVINVSCIVLYFKTLSFDKLDSKYFNVQIVKFHYSHILFSLCCHLIFQPIQQMLPRFMHGNVFFFDYVNKNAMWELGIRAGI